MTPAPNNTPTKQELELINSYTRNPLTEDQVYCFNVTLCDNEVDRDFERFSVDALKELQPLFIGRTGISDHSMSSSDQKARIFTTWLEEDKTKKTSVGESYTALRAKAYMLITDENRNMISQIEGGIKKEVSVGCSMGSMTCSVCGKDMKTHECQHLKGKTYGKKLCHGILDDAKDAYEWSFVAVPAQKNAGVTKSCKNESFRKTVSDKLQGSEKYFSKKYVEALEKKALEGEFYRKQLTADIRKYALITMNRVNVDSFTAHCEKMEISDLKELADSLRSQASEIIPVTLQLKSPTVKKTDSNNNSFKI